MFILTINVVNLIPPQLFIPRTIITKNVLKVKSKSLIFPKKCSHGSNQLYIYRERETVWLPNAAVRMFAQNYSAIVNISLFAFLYLPTFPPSLSLPTSLPALPPSLPALHPTLLSPPLPSPPLRPLPPFPSLPSPPPSLPPYLH